MIVNYWPDMNDPIHYFSHPLPVNSLPEQWIRFYRTNRYLKKLSSEELRARTADVASNMLYLADDGKYRPRFFIRNDGIYSPIRNLDYLRMVVDIVEEERLRSSAYVRTPLDPTRLQIAKRLTDESWCQRPDWITASRLSLEKYELPRMLFRFSKANWNLEFIRYGITHITPASRYKEAESNAVKDDELSIHWYDNNLSPCKLEGQDYFALCLSSEYDYRLFRDFQSDSCVAIKDPMSFSRRLRNAIDRYNGTNPDLKIKAMYECPVIYIDPFFLEPPETLREIHFFKHFRYAYQTEFRYTLTTAKEVQLQPFFLELGSLEDIAELVVAPKGSKLNEATE